MGDRSPADGNFDGDFDGAPPRSGRHPGDAPATSTELEPGDGLEDATQGRGSSGDGSRRRRVLLLLGTLALLVGATFGINAWADPYGVFGVGRYHVVSREWLDRSYRAQLLARRREAPDVLVLGSSTAKDVSPRTMRDLHPNLDGFTAEVANGTPLDAYALAALASQRFPDDFPHLIWGLDVGALQGGPPNPATVTHTPELRRQFHGWERIRLSIAAAAPLLDIRRVPASIRIIREGPRRELPDIDDVYDRRGEANDFTAVDLEGFRQRTGLPNPDPAFVPRSGELDDEQLRYVDRLLELANEHGDVPVVLLPPIEPAHLDELERTEWGASRERLLDELERLQRARDFTIADATEVASFGGEPDGFQDEFHTDAANGRRLVAWLDARKLLVPESGKDDG